MKSIIVSLLLFASCTVFGHKFYVSITDLEYNSQKSRIEGSIKLTAHDFELILENKFDEKITIENVNDTSRIGRYMQLYLFDHVKLYSNGKIARPTYIGKEVSLTQDLYFYFVFEQISNPKSIKIVNTVLFDLFPNQQNIVHYQYNQQTKSVTLVASKTEDSIRFE